MNIDLEDIIKQENLKENPFRVPEDYFSTLSERIIQRIDESEQKESKEEPARKAYFIGFRKLRWAVSAACIIACLAGVSFFLKDNSQNIAMDDTKVEQQNNANAEDAMMQAADYAMFDNQDMYHFLAEE